MTTRRYVIKTHKKLTRPQARILRLLGFNVENSAAKVDQGTLFIAELTQSQVELLKAEPWVKYVEQETFATTQPVRQIPIERLECIIFVDENYYLPADASEPVDQSSTFDQCMAALAPFKEDLSKCLKEHQLPEASVVIEREIELIAMLFVSSTKAAAEVMNTLPGVKSLWLRTFKK